MKRSSSESEEKNIDLHIQPKIILTSNLPDQASKSFSDILNNSDEESPTDVKNFFLENKPLPKFLGNMVARSGFIDPSNVSASSDSEEHEGTHRSKVASIKSKKASMFENMRSDSKNSIKYSTITFNEGLPSLKKLTSGFGFEARESSPLVLAKFPSNAGSEFHSINQSFENSTSAKGGSNNRAISIMIPDQTTKKRFVKQLAEHNEGPEQRNTSEINIKSSTLGELDPTKVAARSSNLIMTRAFIRAAFRQAIEKNRDLDPTKRELEMLKDKSFVANADEFKRKKTGKAKRRPLPNLRKILQTHGILSKDIKVSEMNRIMKELSKARTLKQNIKRQWKIIKIVLKRRLRFLGVIRRFFHWRLHPVGQLRLAWDCFSTILIFYDLLMIPFQMGFDMNIEGFLLYFERMEDIFFFVDLLINFLTGFYQGQLLIMSGRRIAKRYLKSWFLVDLTATMTSSLVLDSIFPQSEDSSSNRGNAFRLLKFLRFIRFMRVLRALRLKRIFSRMEEFFYSTFYLSVKGLIILLFYIAFLAHLSACLWHFVGTSFTDDDITTADSWMALAGYDQLPMADQYVVSLYWAITTMLTVGYGDIVPVNAIERIVNIIVMLLGCGIFGYSMNKIGELVQNLNRNANQTRQIYHNINKYMDKMDVTKSLRAKVIQYLDYMNENQRHGKLAEEQVFSVLSESLREEIRKDINGKEAYHYIKDLMNLYNDLSILGSKCIICGDENHDARSCYRIHYVPDSKLVLQNYKKESKVFCSHFERKPRKKFNALSNQSEVAYLAGIFIDEHPEEANKLAAAETFKKKPSYPPGKYTSNASAINQTIPEENDRAEQSPRRPSGGKQTRVLNVRNSGPRISFATDEEDVDRYASPRLPPKHSLLGLASPELQLREFFARRGSSPSNTMKLQLYGFDNPNPASLIDEQVMRAFEGSYWASELQKLESQNVVFDMVCNYTVYFPHNNIKNILGEPEAKSPLLTDRTSPLKRGSVSHADLRFGKSGDSPITPKTPKLPKTKGSSQKAQKAKSEKNLLQSKQLKKGKNMSEVFKR